MIWGPFLLALALGLVVSAGLYFAYMWPQVEPDDDADDGDDARDPNVVADAAPAASTDEPPAESKPSDPTPEPSEPPPA